MASAIKVAVYWGDILYDTVLCKPKQRVTVGKKAGNTVVLDLGKHSSVENLELVTLRDGGTAVLSFDRNVDGLVRYKAGPLPLLNAINEKKALASADGLYSLPIGETDRAELVIGHVTFLIDWVPKMRLVRRRSMINFRNIFTILLYLAVIIPTTMFVEEKKPEEKEKEPERLVQMMKREKPKPAPKPKPAEAAAGPKKTADGGAQKGDPGKATLKKPTAAESLRSANLSSLASSLTSLTATAAGPKVDSLKPGEAFAPIAQAGTGGFTTDGIKQGGGGKGIGIGRTVGQGEGGFGGTGKLGLAGSAVGSANSGRGGKPGVESAGLDKDVIDTIVRQRKDRIRLCYERQLNFKPNLSGKLTVQFVIGKDGNVLQSTLAEDTMKDEAVKKCLLSEVKTWTFPRPQGGTVVTVDYPFVFESGGR